MNKYTINKQYFGNDTFRQGQEALIDGILAGQDSLGIMPTGGGKSLCYQVPALLLPGLTLVISPLISLMKDQVASLQEAGVSAAYLNSSLGNEEYHQVYQKVRQGAYQLLYIAPERLDSEHFQQLIGGQAVSLVAVDEAHCISQWGQDFRPSYLKIPDFINRLPQRPVVAAFTATATEAVREDIVRLLDLRDPAVLVTGFDRPNLYFEVWRPKNKLGELLSLVEGWTGRSGIVYCATRAKVEEVCQALNSRGIAATQYHAGLSDQERRENQDDFRFDRKPVMVATNAFGMGIDKSNVGFVIHYNMPKSLEAYYQEAGRAGRDGESADCILLYAGSDVNTMQFLIERSGENDERSEQEREAARKRDYQRLEIMIGYCKTAQCLRGYLLDYFGQRHEEVCENCGNCRGEYVQQDITLPAQMILSCVKRIYDKLNYKVGRSLVIQVLRGSKDQRVLNLGLDGLSTYGIMSRDTKETLQKYIDYLEQLGYLYTEMEHRTLCLTEKAGNVLYRGEKVEMKTKVEPVEREAKSPRRTQDLGHIDDVELFETLKRVRAQTARSEGVPPYIVFSNATLRDMSQKAPRTHWEFLEVSGVGEVKAARYGEAFLQAIRDYFQE